MWEKLKALAFFLAVVAIALLVYGWSNARRDALKLKMTVAAENKVIDAAAARESQRNRDLQTAIAQIEALKKEPKTPQQTASALQGYLKLPVPIEGIPLPVDTPSDAAIAGSVVVPAVSNLPDNPRPKPVPQGLSQNSATIPAADIEPLYNYVQDCRECKLKLDAANQNFADAKSQVAAMARERDAALSANHPGMLKKLKSRSLYFLIGVGSGAVLAITANHQRVSFHP
jgi:hypothetical protein